MTILHDSDIEPYRVHAQSIMSHIDPDDTPFIAAALALQCDIWSDDEHFQKQNKVKTWKTKELIYLIQ